MRAFMAVALLSAVLVSCKKPPPAAPKLGWVKVEGMAHECYYPPAWDTLGPGDRKLARANTLKEMMTQWTGARNDGVKLDQQIVTDLETALLGEPESVEFVASKNASYCEKFMQSGTGTAEWSSWLTGLPAKINEGECYHPLVDEIYYYLDINRSWQAPAAVCKGDKVSVHGSENDYYRIVANGPWINAAGDLSQPAGGTELPCNIEGCFKGQLVVRYTGEDGAVVVWPAGLGVVITAPGAGHLEVTINDDSFEDNVYKVESGLQHHTSVEYQPAP